MSLPANKIIAAPYALVGSVGVVAEMVNGYKFLKEHGFEPITMVAGKYKRTVTPLGEITDDAKQHFQVQLESIHRLLIESVKKYRNIDTDKVCNGDFWTATQSLELGLGLVDELGTSSDHLFKLNQSKDLIVLSQKKGRFEQGTLRMAAYLADTIIAKFGSGSDLM
jgi:serine protease SohB